MELLTAGQRDGPSLRSWRRSLALLAVRLAKLAGSWDFADCVCLFIVMVGVLILCNAASAVSLLRPGGVRVLSRSGLVAQPCGQRMVLCTTIALRFNISKCH